MKLLAPNYMKNSNSSSCCLESCLRARGLPLGRFRLRGGPGATVARGRCASCDRDRTRAIMRAARTPIMTAKQRHIRPKAATNQSCEPRRGSPDDTVPSSFGWESSTDSPEMNAPNTSRWRGGEGDGGVECGRGDSMGGRGGGDIEGGVNGVGRRGDGGGGAGGGRGGSGAGGVGEHPSTRPSAMPWSL